MPHEKGDGGEVQPSDGMIELEYEGPFMTRRLADNIMHNLRLCLTNVTADEGLTHNRPGPRSVTIGLETND